MAEKWQGAAVPHFPIQRNVAWDEAYIRTKWHLDPSNRLTTIHQRYRQTGQTGQRSCSIRRTVKAKFHYAMQLASQQLDSLKEFGLCL